jgi:hypothetical protein
MMAKRDVRYPHTIGFRVTDETWLRIEQEIAETDLTAHDWCRKVVLDRLDREYGFQKKSASSFIKSFALNSSLFKAFKFSPTRN